MTIRESADQIIDWVAQAGATGDLSSTRAVRFLLRHKKANWKNTKSTPVEFSA